MAVIVRWLAGAKMIAILLAMALAAGPWDAERIGDRWQVALPLLAWACEGSKGRGAEFFLRYAAMFTAAHGTKQALGEAALNRRPHGGDEGFPSAHTSTAVLGASALAHECLKGRPIAQALAIGAAAFTGASRIEAEKHTIWQVFAGVLLGYGCDRALRRPSPMRARIARLFAAAGRTVWLVVALARGRRFQSGP